MTSTLEESSSALSAPHRFDDLALWARVLRRCVRDEGSGCWLWQGAQTDDGYGRIRDPRTHRLVRVHRLALAVAMAGHPLPGGLVVDHACHDAHECARTAGPCQHRRCVNPEHLQLLTPGENVRRRTEGTTCIRGHKLTIRRDGARRCRTCEALYRRRTRWTPVQQAAWPTLPLLLGQPGSPGAEPPNV